MFESQTAPESSAILARPTRLLYLALLAALACAPERTDPAPAEAKPDSQHERAKRAAVLFEDAKERCLGLARQAMARKQTLENGETRIDAGSFFATTAQPELAVVARFHTLGFEQTHSIRWAYERSVIDALDQLRRIQRQLCDDVDNNWTQAERYQKRISEHVAAFNGYWATIDRHLTISDEDRRRILAEYAPLAEESMAYVRDRVSSQEDGTSWLNEKTEPGADLVDPAQQRAAREQQEWRARQQARREALHREAIQQWRAGAGERPREMPSLGYRPPPDAAGESPAARLERWHGGYLDATVGVRLALKRYRMVRDSGNDAQRRAACRALYGSTADLLQAEELFAAPVAAVGEAFRDAQLELRRLAEACLAGDRTAEADRLAEANRLLERASARLEDAGG